MKNHSPIEELLKLRRKRRTEKVSIVEKTAGLKHSKIINQ
jgi:hypothetical protein